MSFGVSLWSAVGCQAAAVGPSLGAFVIASLDWQWAFYLNVPLGKTTVGCNSTHARRRWNARQFQTTVRFSRINNHATVA